MTPEAALEAALPPMLRASRPGAIGLAVSGGGDSLALMHLCAAAALPAPLHVVTVDHGLRPEAAAEARGVAAAAGALGLTHDTLRWGGWDGQGNLQDAARRARRRLIADWARGREVTLVLTGHTLDDQAETLLMRLARGSGVDGLAGIAPLRRAAGLHWGRPLLAVRRAALRDWLAARGLAWVEDPSNEDRRFDRVRARDLLAPLTDLGLTPERLGELARHMQAARPVLDAAMRALAAAAVAEEAGSLKIDRAAFAAALPETRHRLLARALMWISGSPYRPRFAALESAAEALAEGRAATLAGCLLRPEGGAARLLREPKAALAAPPVPAGQAWDGRWRIVGPVLAGDLVGPLGAAGLADCPDWRDAGLPRELLLGSPALWRAGRLVAAPLAGRRAGFEARLEGPGFAAALEPG